MPIWGFPLAWTLKRGCSPKPTAAKLLEKELSDPKYKPRVVAMGTNTDPYQPIERRLHIMRSIVATFARFNHPVTILTKAHLITRDIDILGPMAQKNLTRAMVSITTQDKALARSMEPRASAPEKRFDAIRQLAEAGVETGIMTGPMIPGLNDDEMETIMEKAASLGATFSAHTILRLPLEVSPLFQEWLETFAPNRARRIMRHIRDMNGGRDYDPHWSRGREIKTPYALLINQRNRAARARLGFDGNAQGSTFPSSACRWKYPASSDCSSNFNAPHGRHFIGARFAKLTFSARSDFDGGERKHARQGTTVLKLDLLTANEKAVCPRFMVEGMIPFWCKQGIDVQVRPLGAPARRPDISFAHVARTFVDDKLLEEERRIAPVLNGAVSDISKRKISTGIVERDSDYCGAVIVKSNLNFHGASERQDRPFPLRFAAGLTRRFNISIPSAISQNLPRYGYLVFDNKDAVPAWAWRNKDIIVEKFLPEMDGEYFVTRSWLFFGDEHYVSRLRSKSPIVKANNAHDHDTLEFPPPELVEMRAQFGFDFGKFDYVERDGRVVLLDINSTPTMVGRTPRHMALLERFASALTGYLATPN